jgi:hypothetical protein
MEFKEQNTPRIATRVLTNENHPKRSYFMNNKFHEEYATNPRTIKPIFFKAIAYCKLESTTDRREENRNNILLLKTTEEKPIQTKQPILMCNPKGIK